MKKTEPGRSTWSKRGGGQPTPTLGVNEPTARRLALLRLVQERARPPLLQTRPLGGPPWSGITPPWSGSCASHLPGLVQAGGDRAAELPARAALRPLWAGIAGLTARQSMNRQVVRRRRI